MSKKTLIIITIVLVIFASISTYLITTNQQEDNYDRTISWNKAIDILNTGEVKEVFQSHNLNVTLTLKNGTIISTQEPAIDNIFEEIEKCGKPCNNIILSTE
jgi:hypothetical protein